MKKRTLTGPEAAAALAKQAANADQRGLSWSLDPTMPGHAIFFRVTVEGRDTPTVVQLLPNGTWSLAR